MIAVPWVQALALQRHTESNFFENSMIECADAQVL